MGEIPHTSVLLHEVLAAFENSSIKIFVDGTLGAGGHAEAILKAHPEIELYLAIDQDPDALQIAEKRLSAWKDKLKLIHSNFDQLNTVVQKHCQDTQIDAILLDLGVSSMQLDRPEKGFSFMREGPLDMRMDPTLEMTAADVVNTFSEQELGRIFRDYGEEKQWRKAARALVEARNRKAILTTEELVSILRPMFSWKKKGVNPLTLIFQALRIYVNRELDVLEKVIPQAISLLTPGGRLAIISFHSLEDRIVKNLFRESASDKENTVGLAGLFLNKIPEAFVVTRKPIVPSDQEVQVNPRSRSAKLRILEKLSK